MFQLFRLSGDRRLNPVPPQCPDYKDHDASDAERNVQGDVETGSEADGDIEVGGE